jgi:hypothetical protein
MGRRESHLPAAPYISGHGVDLRGYRVDDETSWADDAQCRLLVNMHPDGMTLEEIGLVLWSKRTGKPMSRERIRQIEAEAVAKLKHNRAAKEAHAMAEERRSRAAPSMLMEDHQPEGEWPTYEDSRRLQQRGNKGSWGWDGEARPPLAQGGESGE